MRNGWNSGKNAISCQVTLSLTHRTFSYFVHTSVVFRIDLDVLYSFSGSHLWWSANPGIGGGGGGFRALSFYGPCLLFLLRKWHKRKVVMFYFRQMIFKWHQWISFIKTRMTKSINAEHNKAVHRQKGHLLSKTS